MMGTMRLSMRIWNDPRMLMGFLVGRSETD